MTVTVSISGRAEADLTRQYRYYLDKASLEIGERFLAAFDARITRLAKSPELGRRRRFRSPELAGVRSLSIGGKFSSHLIFYRITGETLSIERVMHGARDLPQRLLEHPEEYT